MLDPVSGTEALMNAGLPCRPPHVLVSRWQALLAGDVPKYLDVTHESGKGVPGTRYAFVAVTDAAVCYLRAEHDDDVWDQERISFVRRPQSLTPRKLVAWRRPLTLITEVGLGDDTWHWTSAGEATWAPAYVLKFGEEAIEIPLKGQQRWGQAPDPTPVLDLLTAVWRASSA